VQIERLVVDFDNGYDPIVITDKNLNEEIRIENARYMGFMVSKSAAKRYFRTLEDRNIPFVAEYWPNGFRVYSDDPGRYLIELNVCPRHKEICLTDIHTKDTFLYASIGGFKSRINNGCSPCESPRLYWCEKLHFVDKNAAKMLDFILNTD
jgi:hypothetical protein